MTPVELSPPCIYVFLSAGRCGLKEESSSQVNDFQNILREWVCVPRFQPEKPFVIWLTPRMKHTNMTNTEEGVMNDKKNHETTSCRYYP